MYSIFRIKNASKDLNTDLPTTTATRLMCKLSSMFEASVMKVGGTETLKFGPIPQFGFVVVVIFLHFFFCY